MASHKERDIEANRREYGEAYHSFEWVSEDQAGRATRETDQILASLSSRVELGFLNTKLDCRDLSPGCLICGRGEWSCLFINSTCNARCFYCPTEQPSRSEPMTNGIRFANPQDYAGYMEKFKIRGVGLSGGEPLLTFDRTLQFLTRIKKRSGIHRSDDFLRGHQFILLVKVEVLAQPLFIRPLQVVWNCLMGVSLLLDYPLNLVFWGFRPRPPFAMSW